MTNEKTIEKINEAIEKKNKQIKMLEAQRREIETQIKGVKNEIAVLEEEREAKKGNILADLAKKNGLSIDELITALEQKDFLGVQDKIETKA